MIHIQIGVEVDEKYCEMNIYHTTRTALETTMTYSGSVSFCVELRCFTITSANSFFITAINTTARQLKGTCNRCSKP
jgi:hypothetical protein